jgi:hypothetical protein
MADLLSSVIAAHGGLDRRRTVRAITICRPKFQQTPKKQPGVKA